jgi:hypothetical protein
VQDYYQLLNVSRAADGRKIRRAYLKLVKIYHPDLSKDSSTEAMFRKLTEAYETLSNPRLREDYDATLAPYVPSARSAKTVPKAAFSRKKPKPKTKVTRQPHGIGRALFTPRYWLYALILVVIPLRLSRMEIGNRNDLSDQQRRFEFDARLKDAQRQALVSPRSCASVVAPVRDKAVEAKERGLVTRLEFNCLTFRNENAAAIQLFMQQVHGVTPAEAVFGNVDARELYYKAYMLAYRLDQDVAHQIRPRMRELLRDDRDAFANILLLESREKTSTP